MRTGIYVRVSTEEQAREGFSIRAQIEKLKNYAKLKDWTIVDIYKDEGISGKNIVDRPDINRLINDIKNNKVNNVLVFKIDRLTRSTKNLIELVEFFNFHHCAFNSLMESIDTNSATGRMFIKIIGIFAEFERENLIERVKIGFERKSKEGYTLCSRTASYGYIRRKGQKIQEIVLEEAIIVKEIFQKFVNENYSMTEIAKFLNAKGIPTKENCKWSSKTIKVILTNTNYIGKVRHLINDKINYTDNDGIHKPIIDEDIYYQAQEKINLMKKITRTKHPKSDVYFTGIAECVECGTKLTPKRSYKKKNDTVIACYPMYRCLDSVKGLCNAPTCSHIKLENAFQEYLEKFEDFTETNISIENKDTAEIQNNNLEIEKQDIINRLDKFKKRLNQVIDLYIEQQIDFNTYQEMAKKIKDKVFILEIRLSELKMKEEISIQPKIKKNKIISNLKQNWCNLDDNAKMLFLQKFVNKIVVSKTGTKNDKSGKVIIHDIQFNDI